jgi:chromate transport protein ChrA
MSYPPYGLDCLLAIFAPAWLLIAGALPFSSRIRAKRWARGALSGANATVVGLLVAALYRPVFNESVRDALERWKAPPWLVLVACSLIGQLLLARQRRDEAPFNVAERRVGRARALGRCLPRTHAPTRAIARAARVT